MPDDKTDPGAQDRARIAGGQDYEVQHFADRYGLTPDEAREIIRQAGPSREKAEELAQRRVGRPREV